MDPAGAEFVHTVVEAMKLAFADREAYYGDPKFSLVPMDELLGEAYPSGRRQQVTIEPRASFAPASSMASARAGAQDFRGAGQGRRQGGERAHPRADDGASPAGLTGAMRRSRRSRRKRARRGDTVHIDAVVAAT